MSETTTPRDGAQTAEQTQKADGVNRRTFIKGAGVAVAAAAISSPASAQSTETATPEGPEWQTGRGGLNWSSPYVSDPYFSESALVRARHRMEWGTDDAALAAYEDDGGEKAMLPGYVPREDTENVLTVSADKYDFPSARVFPRGETYDDDGDTSTDEVPVSALDATHWATTGATNGSVSVSDADLDVASSLSISSSAVASGETVTATFSDVSLTDAAEKRFLQFVVNVDTLTSGATVEVAVLDDDGDEKVVTASPGADTSLASVFAAATGDGFVLQQRLADLSTVANGDGTFDSIDSVEVRVKDADATVTFTALDVERKSRWVFGSYLANEGTDSEERTKRYEPGPGTFTVTGLDTLSDALAATDAILHDVEQPFRYTLGDGTLAYEFRFVEATDYPGYDWILEQRGKAEVPTAIDLTHSGLSYHDEVTAPPNRYKSVWTAEGVDGTAFGDIDDTSKTYHGGSYESEGSTVELRAATTADTVYAFGSDLLLTASNRDAAEVDSASGGSGGGAAPAEKGGGFAPMMWGSLVAVLGAVVAKFRGWF